jgi:hypothetical protein
MAHFIKQAWFYLDKHFVNTVTVILNCFRFQISIDVQRNRIRSNSLLFKFHVRIKGTRSKTAMTST